MHAQTAPQTLDLARRAAPRAFGTGYGRSSSYGAPRSYSRTSVPPRFRVV